MKIQDLIAAITVWREARGEAYETKVGVAHVIRNRTTDRLWPDKVANVCMQPYQFSCWNKDDPNFKKWPDEDSTVWHECLSAWIASGELEDITNGSNHYHSYDNLYDYPYWAKRKDIEVTLGRIKFYALRN